MADFLKAYDRTNRNEGDDYSYSNDPNDPGGETFMGISRVHWPDWPGWGLVDEAGKGRSFPRNLGYYPQLLQLARGFYKRVFWDPMNLDLLENQEVAEKLFDTAVNLGCRAAVKFLQRALNAANRRGKLWPDLKIDGGLGPATVAAVRACEKRNRAKGVLAGIKALQGAHYFNLMEKNEALEEFCLGWLARAMA